MNYNEINCPIMMRYLLLFLFSFFLISTSSEAQKLPKKERKAWKKKLKRLSPASYKKLTEDFSKLRTEKAELEAQIKDQDASIKQQNELQSSYDSKISSLQNKIEELSATAVENEKIAQNAPTNGVLFKVQIGAFKNKDLSKYFDKFDNFGGELTDAGTQKITLGFFRDYWEADTFKKYIREMGVSDAWIVPFKDGQRVEMKDVLEGVN